MAMIVQFHKGVAIKKFNLDKPIVQFGRSPDSDIFIDEAVVSVHHAVIEKLAGSESGHTFEFYIKDLKSTNSTFVNGKKIARKRLVHNDIIRIGWTNFTFIDGIRELPDKTSKIHKSWIPGIYYTEE